MCEALLSHNRVLECEIPRYVENGELNGFDLGNRYDFSVGFSLAVEHDVIAGAVECVFEFELGVQFELGL